MHREPSVSWKCSGFMLVCSRSLLWIVWNTLVRVRSLYGFVQTLTIDVSLGLLEISHKHQKLTWSFFLDFFFPPLCLEKSACMVTVRLYCCYLQWNKHAWWSLHIVTFGFLFLLYFVYETISVKNFCQMCVWFVLVIMLAIIFKIRKCRVKNYIRDNTWFQCTQCISQGICDKHMHYL